ncbi:methyl-accepting chemotaxis protein [Bacillota bacterium LX-D]|nr:methyl-accepting chemotaxis protein [Bacillota bacterium LX-D]
MWFKKKQTVCNIEKIKKTDDQLRAEGLRLAMPYPYFIRDMDFNIIEISPAMEKLTGCPKEEALKKKCYGIFSSTKCGKNCIVQKHLQESKEPVWDIYLERKNRAGKKFETLTSYTPYFSEDGKVLGAIETVRDISEEKAMMNRLSAQSDHISSASQEFAASSQETLAMSSNLSNTAERQVSNLNICQEEIVKLNQESSAVAQDSDKIKESVTTLNDAVKSTVDGMSELSKKAGEIGNIVNSITGIADQTNLLALNAAIEAARAGEHGRGFAVVAEEVRKLAESSAAFSKEINSSLGDIVKLVNNVASQANETNAKLRDSEKAINRVIEWIDNISVSVDHLSQLLEENVAEAQNTANISVNQTNAMEEISTISQELAQVAQDIREEVDVIAKITHLK